MKYKRLGDLLIGAGTITEAELERALKIQKEAESKDRLGTVLIKNGIITEEQLIDTLRMQLGIEFIDLSKTPIPTELAQALPKAIAQQYQVVPVKLVKDELYLAMVDPMNFYAIEEVRRSVRRKIVPMVAKAEALEHAIQVLYSNEGAAKAIEELRREVAASGETAQASFSGEAFVTNQIGDENAENAPTIRLVNSIIERAVTERASDIHIEAREHEMTVRMRIDGGMRDILTIPNDIRSSVVSRFKIMAGLNITERRIPQDGRFNVLVHDKNIDLRVSTLPTVYGEKIVARLLDKSTGLVSKENIGLTGEDLEKYNGIIKRSYGMILIVGPTGSGKSTTMYTMMNELNRKEINMVTLEDPVEYNIEGINQVQVNDKVGMGFAEGLRSILRQDPDIIAVGEIRDNETADIAMRSAITGHLVLSTLHTNDAVGTVDRLRDIGVEPYMIASALKGVVSQRLVKRICPNCKTSYTPTEEELSELGMDPESYPGRESLKFYRGTGCAECYNTGYRGRIAVFEILSIDSKIRNLIYMNAGREAIDKALYEDGSKFVSLRQNAVRRVLEGTTTAEEAVRITNEE